LYKILKTYFKIVISFVMLFSSTLHIVGEKSYCFRLYLNDKGESIFNKNAPEKFISPESIERRLIHQIPVDETDFPISDVIITEINNIGFEYVTQSKWLKTLVVETTDSSAVEKLNGISYIDSIKCVWSGTERTVANPCPEDTSRFYSQDSVLSLDYGYGDEQISLLNGIQLHNRGFKGKGVRIAVIDAGFMNVNRIEVFSSLHLIGVKNVTFPNSSFYCDDEHGTKVLSCLAANKRGVLIGTAPESDYLLIKSEDTRGEFPVEEDFWVAAVEYADSFGIDVISSSLGYYVFDDVVNNYSPTDLNGRTAFASKAAEIAAEKGILVISSAGNEGNSNWGKITFPADADKILTVGSINSDKQRSSFSSIGLTADFRIKPDVVALGSAVSVINSAGQVINVNGTSFSAPTVAGLVACLRQAFPLLNNADLIKLIRESSSRSQLPDAQLGYGFPDFMKAYNEANRQ
jgi:subtilisin family serine protease